MVAAITRPVTMTVRGNATTRTKMMTTAPPTSGSFRVDRATPVVTARRAEGQRLHFDLGTCGHDRGRRVSATTSLVPAPDPYAVLYKPPTPHEQRIATRIASSSGFESPSNRTTSPMAIVSGRCSLPQPPQRRSPPTTAVKSWVYPALRRRVSASTSVSIKLTPSRLIFDGPTQCRLQLDPREQTTTAPARATITLQSAYVSRPMTLDALMQVRSWCWWPVALRERLCRWPTR